MRITCGSLSISRMWIMKNWGALLVILMAATGICRAQDVTYYVDQTGIGFDDGLVTGTIETDGTTGTLETGNIIAWNLVLSEGLGGGLYDTYDLTSGVGGNSTLAITDPSGLTATATNLLYNFTATGEFEIYQTADASVAWELGPGPDGFEYLEPQGPDGDQAPLYFSSQPVTIGSTPEPSTYGSALIGFGLLLLLTRKRLFRTF
jgi:hypothetical protein